jgi:hypothetical protein
MISMPSPKISKSLLIVSLAVVAAGILTFMALAYSPVIFQEGNPWPQIKGIVRLNFGDAELVKLPGSESRYMTKSGNGREIIMDFMGERGYELTEQLGSGYLFASPDGKSADVTHRYYSRHYSLWHVSENPPAAGANDGSWATAANGDGMTFRYPKALSADYATAAEWPPVVTVRDGTFSCATTPQEVSGMLETTAQRFVDDRTYCVNVTNEGAAGSVYSSYAYTTAKDGKLVEVSFTIRYPNCYNYDDERSRACVREREAFDIDATVDRIVQTIAWAPSAGESLAAQIRKCILMSDAASKEECDGLLSRIADFDACAAAGFPIMKSNPPQCATPDGRTFIETR